LKRARRRADEKRISEEHRAHGRPRAENILVPDLDRRDDRRRDPVAMDRIGLDILEAKRKEHNLDSVREISTHIAACAKKGLGTDDSARIDLRELKA
jgi:hypothetical protein